MQGIFKFLYILLIALNTNLFSINVDSLLKVAENPTSNNRLRWHNYYESGWVLVYSKPDTALILAERSLEFAKKLNSSHLESKSYNLFASCYQIKQNYKQAINYYKKCELIGVKGFGGKGDDQILVVAYSNLGAMYLNAGDYNRAKLYQVRAFNIAIKTNDKTRLASIYNNLSLVYNSTDFQDYNKAIDYAKKSLKLYDFLSDEPSVGMVYGTMGAIYLNLFDLEKALSYFNQSLKIALKYGNIYEEIVLNFEIGDIYFKKKNYDEATTFYLSSIEKSKKVDNIEGLRDGYEKLYKVFKEKGDIIQALKYHEIFSETTKKYDEYEIKTALQKKELEFDYDEKKRVDKLELETKELEIKNQKTEFDLNKAQIERDRTLKIALAFLLVVVGVFAAFMVNRFRIIKRQKHIIELKSKQTNDQKNLLETKNEEVLASINYAKRIQDGILASKELLDKNLQNNFVVFKPKDIVSGDFYWATEHNGLFYLAVCDSTGHGVPGAFMSILNIGLLSEAIKEKNIRQPNEILDYVRMRLIETISGDGQKDGMDGVLMSFDFDLPFYEKPDDAHENYTCKILYAAANNQPILIRNQEHIELAKDKMPIGKGEKTDNFNLYGIGAKKGDMIYVYTDGYADQFGGDKGKKYMYKQLNEQLANISNLPIETQKMVLSQNFESWKGKNEQVDDVCLFGVRI